jgi:NAD+ synthase (glutamine-hydrolysing)
VKICIAQQNYHLGNFESNAAQMIQAIEQAKKDNADLIVFSELSVCGYPFTDCFEYPEYLEACYAAIQKIASHATHIGVLIGAPATNPVPEGKDIFNAAYYLYEGKVQQIIHKSLLPTYDIFDEYRYFEPAQSWKCMVHKGVKIAVTICEDIWDIAENPLYQQKPMDILIKEQPELMINLSASPYNYTHAEERLKTVALNVSRYKIPMIYCNTYGAQTEVIFDGGSLAMNTDLSIPIQLKSFEEDLGYIVWNNNVLTATEKTISLTNNPLQYESPKIINATQSIDSIHQALLLGIRDYFKKMGFKKAIVASSGGIDSAVVLALACEALGSENVNALLLPSAFSTDHSVHDAVTLSENLKNHYDIISIKDVFDAYEVALKPTFKELPFSVAEENLQSRIRGAMVMALSNKFGSILLNTSNKSELATGYGTLYGDMTGGLGILGDLYKIQVYALAEYINREKEIIPKNILLKAPSAELRPGQKDSDSLPPYEILDAILYQYIEQRKGIQFLIQQGFDENIVKKVITLVNNNEYKRFQFCPILRVSPKAFGMGRRMPLVGKFFTE